MINGDNVMVIESMFGKVLMLDRNTGATLTTFGSFGTLPGELSLPLDLVLVGTHDDVFVTSNVTKRIEVFPGAGSL